MTFENFFSDYLGNVDWLDVIVGAVVLFALAWVWFGPLFGDMWRGETGREMSQPDPATLVRGFVEFFLYGLGIALVYPALHVTFQNASSFQTLLVTSLVVSFLFTGVPLAGRVTWEGSSMKLWGINWGFWFVGSFAYAYIVLDLMA